MKTKTSTCTYENKIMNTEESFWISVFGTSHGNQFTNACNHALEGRKNDFGKVIPWAQISILCNSKFDKIIPNEHSMISNLLPLPIKLRSKLNCMVTILIFLFFHAG
jgi:hypothetical protein